MRKRITPAHAGKSTTQDLSREEEVGSPPHTRGKVEFFVVSQRVERITPAHAGKSKKLINLIIIVQDHPRTRGEKTNLKNVTMIDAGSPPHTRGKASKLFKYVWAAGITPAHAGKSLPCDGINVNKWDHPRTRGEKYNTIVPDRERTGSPPHARGKAAVILF